MTAREMFLALQKAPTRARFGFGRRAALVNVDIQRAYSDTENFVTAYETDPDQTGHVNRLAEECRRRVFPVVWTYVAYDDGSADCGVWGTRSDTPDSLQNIRPGSPRAELDPRLLLGPSDTVMRKRMASAFFETNLRSLLTHHRIDTVIVTGGSTSGCVRATVVEGLSCGFRVIVPIECVADRHESPHFASLYDMALKYADVLSSAETMAGLRGMPG